MQKGVAEVIKYTLNYTRNGEREHIFEIDGRTKRLYSASFYPDSPDDSGAFFFDLLIAYGIDPQDHDNIYRKELFPIVWGGKPYNYLLQDFYSLSKLCKMCWAIHFLIDKNYRKYQAMNSTNIGSRTVPFCGVSRIPDEDVVFSTTVYMRELGYSVYQSLRFMGDVILYKDHNFSFVQEMNSRFSYPLDEMSNNMAPSSNYGVFDMLLKSPLSKKNPQIREDLENIRNAGFDDFFPLMFKMLMEHERAYSRGK